MSERIWDKFLTEKDKRIFQLAGYGKRGGFGTRPALFIIDVQYNFTGDEPGEPQEEGVLKYRTHCGAAGWKAVPHIERLLKIARAKNLPVFYTVSERRADMIDSGVQVGKSHRGTEKTSTEGSLIRSTHAPAFAVITVRNRSSLFSTIVRTSSLDPSSEMYLVCTLMYARTLW